MQFNCNYIQDINVINMLLVQSNKLQGKYIMILFMGVTGIK